MLVSNIMNIKKEIYRLDADTLPTMPVPHDCVIKTILVDKDNSCISFIFEDGVSEYDSVAYQRPNAKTLIIKYHLIGENEYELYKFLKPSIWHRNGGYECLTDYEKGTHRTLIKLAEDRLEYISHYVAYNAVTVELWGAKAKSVILKLDVETVEYEWGYE